MKTILMTCRECEVSGELGLIIDDVPLGDEEIFSSTSGVLIAHDIIEHQNGPSAIGGVGDEMEALGGVWFTRGGLDDINRINSNSLSVYSSYQQVAFDVVELWRQYEVWGMPVPKVSAIPDFEDDLRDILRHAIAEIPKEDEDAPRDEIAAFIRDAKHLLRSGWAKAVATWDGDQYAANNQFWAIAAAVDPFAGNCNLEGQEYSLTYGDGNAFCEEIYEDFDDEDEE